MRPTESTLLTVVPLLFLCTNAPAQAAALSLFPDTGPQVSVNATGAVDAQPDMAVVSLGVYLLDPDLPKAKASSDAIVTSLLKKLHALQIPDQDISSSSLNIDSDYSEGEKPEFIGYEVSRSITVTRRDLSRLDRLVDQAIQSGTNREFNVTLRSSREKELREQALNLAIEDVKARAARLAAGFGAQLGPVRSIRPGDRQGNVMYSASALPYGGGTFKPGTLRFEAQLSADGSTSISRESSVMVDP